MEEKNRLTLYSPTQAKRLGRFAVSHFSIAIVGAMLAIPVALILSGVNNEVLGYSVLLLGNVVAMSAYVFAGRLLAKSYCWGSLKNFSTGLLAFLFPALIAWAWGSLMLCVAQLPGRVAWDLVGLLLPVSFLCAFPSFLLVLSTLVLGILDGGLPNMIICMLLAGGLPPLLFLLGSIWGGRKNEQRAMQPKEGKEEPDGTQQRDATA